MAGSPLIDPTCEFGSALSDSDVKSILQSLPAFILANGVSCSNQQTQDLNNENLGNFLTGPIALLTKVLAGLHDNGEFARCIWDNFLCGFVQELFFVEAIQGPTGNITLPSPEPTARYTVVGNWGASSSGNYDPINVGGFIGGEHDENADIYTGVISGTNVAGGTVYDITTINSQVTDAVSDYWMRVFAIRTDW